MTCIHRRRGGRHKVCKTIVLARANRKLAVSWAGCLATGQNDRFLIFIRPEPATRALILYWLFLRFTFIRLPSPSIVHTYIVTGIMYRCYKNIYRLPLSLLDIWQRCIRVGYFGWSNNNSTRFYPPLISPYRVRRCQIHVKN